MKVAFRLSPNPKDIKTVNRYFNVEQKQTQIKLLLERTTAVYSHHVALGTAVKNI